MHCFLSNEVRHCFPAEAILLGFQHYIVMLGTTVLIPSSLVPQMGGGKVGHKDDITNTFAMRFSMNYCLSIDTFDSWMCVGTKILSVYYHKIHKLNFGCLKYIKPTLFNFSLIKWKIQTSPYKSTPPVFMFFSNRITNFSIKLWLWFLIDLFEKIFMWDLDRFVSIYTF